MPGLLQRSHWLRFAIIVPMVIGSFIVAHVLTVRGLGELDDESRYLQRTAVQLDLLSALHGELHTMGIATGAAIFARTQAGEAARQRPRRRYLASRRRVWEGFHTYAGLLERQGEGPLVEKLHKDLQTTVHALDRTWRWLDAGAVPGPQGLAVRAAGLEAMRQAQAAILRIRAAHSVRLHQVGLQVAQAGRRVRAAAPLHDALAALVSLVVLWLGVRASRQYARLVEERGRLAQERSQELELFASRVAHDLRNPLGAMTMRLELARRRPTAAGLGRDLSFLGASVGRMRAVIDGLLEFARAAGRPDPGGRAPLAAVASGVVQDFSAEASQRSIDLAIEPMDALSVRCPEGPLSSILGNLLRNAIKYIDGGVSGLRRIRLRARAGAERVRVEVEDSGPGIPPALGPAVFEPYVRGGSTQPGLGLGLATVKRLVEAYRGRVGVVSEPGRGSCFWFELPVAPATA
jgi:signal transduction histidine kinase